MLTVKLTAPESYGIDADQPVMLHGMQIGQIISHELTESGIVFVTAIEPGYRNLVHDDSKFIVNSRLDVKFGLDGMKVLGASTREWVDGVIRLESGDQGAAKARYPLYADAEKAEEGIIGDRPSTTLTLTANTRWCCYEVGEIVDVTPRANAFDIAVHIKPAYRKLLTSESVFWAEGGARGRQPDYPAHLF
nr:Paraquat-inducible protein B [Candidatus Pantoea persica]